VHWLWNTASWGDAPLSDGQARRDLLIKIDAAILDGYRLPPRLEHQLLERFRNADRATPFPFGAYYDEDDVFFSLAERISPEFKERTASALLRRMAIK
jgi:hypothetical protein